MTQERLYTTTQLGRILDLPPAKIRAWARQGLIEPAKRVGRLSFYDFRQLTSARALHRLRDAGASPRHIRKALANLRRWAPDAEIAITQLEALEGGPLVIRTGEGEIAETTGQMRLDLEARADAVHEPAVALRARPGPEISWFERGIEAEEEERLEDAADAYGRAIALDGPKAEVCFNLGNVLYALERTPEAAALFREAVSLESDYAEAWNNLGNALADLGESERAVEAFEQALHLAPGYADPHYNLAETLSALGRQDEARRHWRAYAGIDPRSPWGHEARRRLETP